jgi:uncharacterized protein YndB with AHSA1/START domain
MTMSDPVFTISRTLDAPLSLVWEVYTTAEHLAKWWGPKGFAWVSGDLDFRPGGHFHYCMRPPAGSPMGGEMWGRFDYREIVPKRKIVFTNSFSNAAGDVTRAPFAANFPLRVLNNVSFGESGGKTTLDLTGTPFDATGDEKAFYQSMFPSMNQGFNGTFAQLEDYLASLT